MLDIGYGLRVLALIWRHKGKKRNENLFGEYIIKGRCWLNDLDLNNHMNNARYLRECDFGRYAFFIETGLWDVLEKRKKSNMKDAGIVVSAFQVQYRQSIKFGEKFQIQTRLNGWDNQAFYFEQSMIIDKNQKLAFLLLARIVLLPRHLTIQMLIDDLQIGSIQSPQLSPSIDIFKENYKLNLQQT